MTPETAAAVSVADAAAAAALGVDGISRLDGGPLDSFATYGAGRRVPGVRVGDGDEGTETRLQLVATFGRPLPELGEEVQRVVTDALRRSFPSRAPGPVHAHFTDLIVASEAG